MLVRVAAPLKAQLQATHPNAETTLIRKFAEWKAGVPDDHYWFSKDVRGDDGNLFHVHLIPQNVTQAREAWDELWFDQHQGRWRRRSDRYLLYADGARHGYLLVALLEDPGAHALWTPRCQLMRESFEVVAENFVCFGQVP